MLMELWLGRGIEGSQAEQEASKFGIVIAGSTDIDLQRSFIGVLAEHWAPRALLVAHLSPHVEREARPEPGINHAAKKAAVREFDDPTVPQKLDVHGRRADRVLRASGHE